MTAYKRSMGTHALLLAAWRCIYSLPFWYACMSFKEAATPPPRAAFHRWASPAVNFCSEGSVSGVQLCPRALVLKRVHGNYPIYQLLLMKNSSQGVFFFFFILAPGDHALYCMYTATSKTKQKKNTHWKGLQWEMASFRILTVSRACFFPNWVTVVKVTITRWRVAALHSYPLHLLLTQWIICYNQLSKPFWSAETQTGQQPMVMETKKQENKKRGR